MTTRLKLYNAALRICGERSLASLTESREPRHLLDDVWNDGGVNKCLESGFWIFAELFVRVDYDTEVTPAFGYNRAFSKPTDWVKTSGICSDEYFTAPITLYEDRNNYWYTSIDQIYVRYVSNGAAYGGDLSIWSSAFSDYVAAHFASQIIYQLTNDRKVRADVMALVKTRLTDAKNHNTSSKPPQFPATGRWVNSRSSRTGSGWDRGNRGSLIG